MNAAAPLSLPECDAGCGRVAIRGNFCAEHAKVCNAPSGCGRFVAETRDGLCADCETAACEYELEIYVSAYCTCSSSKPSHVARRRAA